jgi:flavodoxin
VATPKLAVIYYSSTGNTHAMAEAVAEGARAAATVASWILKGRS